MALKVRIEMEAVIRGPKRSQYSDMMGCIMWWIAGEKVNQVQRCLSTSYKRFLGNQNCPVATELGSCVENWAIDLTQASSTPLFHRCTAISYDVVVFFGVGLDVCVEHNLAFA